MWNKENVVLSHNVEKQTEEAEKNARTHREGNEMLTKPSTDTKYRNYNRTHM